MNRPLTMNVLNLTPHAVRVLLPDGREIVFPPSGQIARVAVTLAPFGTLPNGVPLVSSRAGEVTGLPETDGTIIVSRLVAEAIRGSNHLVLVPADLVRDGAGAVIGCRALEVVS